MSVTLQDVPATGTYTEASTLIAPLSDRLDLDVKGASILLQFSEAWPAWWAGDEERYRPGSYSLERLFHAVRVRAADPSAPATVDLVAIHRGGLPPNG